MSVAASTERKFPLGAEVRDGGAHFRVWAPQCQRVEVVLLGADGQSERQVLPLEAEEGGYPAVGDWVVLALNEADGVATIHAVLPRRTAFIRRAVTDLEYTLAWRLHCSQVTARFVLGEDP